MDLEDMNKALAAKWIYKFVNSNDALWMKVVFA